MRLKKSRVSAAIVGLALLAGTMAVPKPAAAATCASNPGDSTCTHQDPVQQGCNADASTVGSADIKDSNNTTIGRVELRYSPKCRSNWSRVTSLIGPQTLWARIQRDDGVNYTDQFNNTTSMYTDMVYAPVRKALSQGAVFINGRYVAAHTPWI